MPNERLKEEVKLGGFIDSRLHRQIMSICKKERMAVERLGFARKLIQEALVYRRKET